DLIDLVVGQPMWERFFTVAPLVLIGTMEKGGHDLAPKHMAMPLGRSNYFCFVCTPVHATQRNAQHSGAFTVSFPRPDQIVQASMAAAPRLDDDEKPSLAAIPVFPARVVEGVLVRDAYLWFECRVDRVLDGFGTNSLIIGEIVAAAVAEGSQRGPDTDDADLLAREPLLAYVSPGRCASIVQSQGFPFHAGMPH
ncbi:MAG: flavin reductase family protein, partial [Thermoleophilia bacterium]